MLQRLRAKWRTWREHERQYKLERALVQNRRKDELAETLSRRTIPSRTAQESATRRSVSCKGGGL